MSRFFRDWASPLLDLSSGLEHLRARWALCFWSVYFGCSVCVYDEHGRHNAVPLTVGACGKLFVVSSLELSKIDEHPVWVQRQQRRGFVHSCTTRVSALQFPFLMQKKRVRCNFWRHTHCFHTRVAVLCSSRIYISLSHTWLVNNDREREWGFVSA